MEIRPYHEKISTGYNEDEYPNLQLWERPSDYMGNTYFGWFVAYAHHRDSDLLTESNWGVAEKILLPLTSEENIEKDQENSFNYHNDDSETFQTVQIFRASHWGVGWVAFIGIHYTNIIALDKAQELNKSIEDYPVLDDEDFSNREYEAANNYWQQCSIRERLDIIGKYGTENNSIFESRHDYLPVDDTGSILQHCTE